MKRSWKFQIDQHATVVITVGLDKSHPNAPGIDSDVFVGIYILDVHNYPKYSPCYPTPGTHDGTKVAAGTPVSATFKLTFSPFTKFAFCETAQEGGYNMYNTGTFSP